MVRTGAHIYVKYGWESTYSILNTSINSVANKKFGLQDKMSSLSLTNNKVNLNKLNQNTVDKYAYGQQSGTASMSFTLSNPWIFGAVLGAPSTPIANGSNWDHTYASSTMTKDARTIQLEVGYDATSSTNIFRTLKGGIVGSLSINAATGGLVDCSADITYGKESAPTNSGTLTPPLVFNGTSGSDTVVQCQDASINIAQNAELLYGLNDHSAVSAFKRVLDITGAFKASWINKTLLGKLIDQLTRDGSGETIGGSYEFILTFERSAAEKIVITLGGLTLNDLGISGIEPVEPLFEDITWTAKTISIVATASASSEE